MPVCSGCHKPVAGYDQLSIRRFEFVPFWGFMVLLLHRMRRVDCRACGVRVEEPLWAIGKHQLTKAYMLFLAHWAIQAIGVDDIQYARGHKYLTLVYETEKHCTRLLWIVPPPAKAM